MLLEASRVGIYVAQFLLSYREYLHLQCLISSQARMKPDAADGQIEASSQMRHVTNAQDTRFVRFFLEL